MIANPAKIQDGVLGTRGVDSRLLVTTPYRLTPRDMLWSLSSIKSEVVDSEELYVTIVELNGALVTALYAYSYEDRINSS
jgi:hypothetical protein